MSLAANLFKFLSNRSDKKRDANLEVDPNITAHYDLPYGREEGNSLDIYYPKETKQKAGVIVNVHGGGYVYGSKENYLHYGMFMASRGFVFVNFNYRLAPKNKFPSPLEDLNQVMIWLQENQDEYFLDLDNVFLVGDSVGAQIASQYCAMKTNHVYAQKFALTIPSNFTIRAIALNCGLYDLTFETNQEKKGNVNMAPLLKDYLGSNWEDMDGQLDVKANITATFPPTFIMTAEYDFLKDEAYPMYEWLRKQGVEAVYRKYGEKGQLHMAHIFHCDMNLPEAKLCNQEQSEFFKKHMQLNDC